MSWHCCRFRYVRLQARARAQCARSARQASRSPLSPLSSSIFSASPVGIKRRAVLCCALCRAVPFRSVPCLLPRLLPCLLPCWLYKHAYIFVPERTHATQHECDAGMLHSCISCILFSFRFIIPLHHFIPFQCISFAVNFMMSVRMHVRT